MAKWYSEEMKLFHTVEKSSQYYVYHWFYTGPAKDWDPTDLKWGYIGIAPYYMIEERYRIEMKECQLNLRPRKRKVIQMIEKFKPKNLIKHRVIGMNLKRNEALQIEAALRPNGYTNKFDQRIWNEVAGG